ncbi:MAG: P-loop NTPase [Nannocystaceae bacterium]
MSSPQAHRRRDGSRSAAESEDGGSSGDKPLPKARIWAIGGGKGGVGKSVIATNLAVNLARSGQKVVIVDGDLGGANLDTMLGCQRPTRSLGDFFARRVPKLDDLAVATGIDNLLLVSGDSDTLGAANPAHAQKLKLIRHLRAIPCNTVVLDLGAGTHFNTLDLYLASDVGIVVTSAEPTAIQNCFAFLKAITLRELERRTGTKQRDAIHGSLRQKLQANRGTPQAAVARETRLVINRARPGEGRRVLDTINGLVGRFLGGSVSLAGTVRNDPAVVRSVQRMEPLAMLAPDSEAAQDISALCRQLAGDENGSEDARLQMGLNEAFEFRGTPLHLQTEDLGQAQGAIRTQIFYGDGSVAYSRRTPYADQFFVRLRASSRDRVRIHHAAIKRGLQQGRIVLKGRGSP